MVLDGSLKTDEAIVGIPENSDSLVSFTFPPTLIVGTVYKVNVYAVVEAANLVSLLLRLIEEKGSTRKLYCSNMRLVMSGSIFGFDFVTFIF